MRFSCQLPLGHDTDDDFLSINNMTETIRAIDKAGLDAVYVTDHPAPSHRWLHGGGHATLDPFVALTVVATASPRLRLHTHILVLAYRNPFVVAKSVASLDRLSGGRVTLGIGTGYLKSEYSAVGVPFDERGSLTDEALTILRQAWTGEPVSHQGGHFEARETVVQPTPVQQPLPIWGGGNAPRAIRRAVELCEGWSPFPASGVLSRTAKTEELANLEQLRDKIRFAKVLSAEIGRTAPLDICVSAFGGTAEALNSRTSAAVSQLVDEYCALVDAGVTWTTVALPAPSRAAFIDNVSWFGEEVANRVRR